MKTIRLTMAQALLKFLDNQYIQIDGEERKFVKGVMGIFGHGNVTGLGEALEQDKGALQFIQGKNEQGMAHAAMAYAKQKNRLEIFACTSSIGPGALNMVTAAGTATVNRIPVLFLPGDIFACRQPDPVLQQIEDPTDYTISANDAFKPVSKYWDRISRPEQLITAALNAMRVLTDPVDTGAVTLSLPQDVQCEAYDYPVEFFAKRVHYIERRTLSQGALERAVQAIHGKKRPLIIAGGGVHYSLAVKELIAFAETFQIPLTETQAGKSAMPWNHPLYMGAVGVTGSLAANRLAKEADLIISVGTRLADFPTASKSAFQHPDVSFLNINVSSFDAMKLNAHMVVADAKEALISLQDALGKAGYESAYAADELKAEKQAWDQEVDRLYAMELPDGLSQTRVIGEINASLDPNDVVVCAAGSLPGDLHRLWRCDHPNTYHMEYGFSCMGYEVSGAFGVKLADPGREVYAFVGDGSFLMLHSELLTSIQEGRKINVLLLDNHGYQCIHNLQRGHGSQGFGNEFRYRSADTNRLTGDYVPVDFSLYARALGVKTYSVRTIDELKEALKSAKEQTVSTLIEIKVLPGTNTDGYESWWRVGVAEVSESGKVLQAYDTMRQKLEVVKEI
ncbi:3D-(3,5/4)-trihydroxycyclohexane-1,2-dione acylhydrolase (decyclizing) [Paenibacillus elgii]|uniref:3D-(3,5/4)-trihydroxycyclohexane-1,2-dione acylhydrolase (Decyclizing) n=1 Tax=Paenibacillus elgii TaxID=189691 RepID=A0A161S4K3_9BACL|nr:3D-(3,5/4)-trihydroxycyclohexane-1,2-dione acylhydrolase (decyclizing) [Paenibacillus elgii]KZE73955.1 3D-(3,5/4)-trihydroxycyclohexane-1,2-dione acylhydrolase (decyclizing) [Paenibacillus elgii]NEN87016.1 3D-(3,5/4)-trihydroxycyclohexane-1,2-dione acylhydrolase (decyclizing) [Paenibacillus elgii]